MKIQIFQRGLPLNHTLVIACCLAAWFSATAPARAQLIDIRPDGSTVTYDGPVTASPSGIRPMAGRIAGRVSNTPLAETPLMVGAAIRDAAARHQLSEDLIEAVAWQESRLRQNAVSPKGARGVMQLMPGTAMRMGVDAAGLSGNVDGGAAYLAQLMQMFDGDLIKTLAAYNAGPGAVTRYGGVPPYRETQAYVAAILDHLSETRP